MFFDTFLYKRKYFSIVQFATLFFVLLFSTQASGEPKVFSPLEEMRRLLEEGCAIPQKEKTINKRKSEKSEQNNETLVSEKEQEEQKSDQEISKGEGDAEGEGKSIRYKYISAKDYFAQGQETGNFILSLISAGAIGTGTYYGIENVSQGYVKMCETNVYKNDHGCFLPPDLSPLLTRSIKGFALLQDGIVNSNQEAQTAINTLFSGGIPYFGADFGTNLNTGDAFLNYGGGVSPAQLYIQGQGWGAGGVQGGLTPYPTYRNTFLNP